MKKYNSNNKKNNNKYHHRHNQNNENNLIDNNCDVLLYLRQAILHYGVWKGKSQQSASLITKDRRLR